MFVGARDVHGVGEYFSSNGVGQLEEETASPQAVVIQPPPARIKLDLQDAETVKQLKSAMAVAPFMLPFILGDKADSDFDERFFDDPVWGQLATKFTRLWIQGFSKFNPDIPNPDSMFVSPHLYPRSVGVLMVLVAIGYRQPSAPQVVDFSNLPKLTQFFDETEGDPTKGVVLAPFFSREEQEGSASPLKASTIAAVGLGLLGVVAFGLVLGGKKRRR